MKSTEKIPLKRSSTVKLAESDSVTLVGHGSGAALVSFLMTSPVANPRGQALFQKAILMSGSSLSPMATARDPSDITMQVGSEMHIY